MADRVAHIVRQRAHGKGQLVRRARIADQRPHEVSRADVVREVGEERVAERIVSKVLDRRAAIRIRMRLAQLALGHLRIARQQKRLDRALPRQVDQLLMRLHRVARPARGKQQQRRDDQHPAARRTPCIDLPRPPSMARSIAPGAAAPGAAGIDAQSRERSEYLTAVGRLSRSPLDQRRAGCGCSRSITA